jgi:hypothetical protein
MILHQYKVMPADISVREHLISIGEPGRWLIIAKDISQAWDKFVRQRFQDRCPNPYYFDISYHKTIRSK